MSRTWGVIGGNFMNFAKKHILLALGMITLAQSTSVKCSVDTALIASGSAIGLVSNLFDGYIINNTIGIVAGALTYKTLKLAGFEGSQGAFIASVLAGALVAKGIFYYGKEFEKWLGKFFIKCGGKLNPQAANTLNVRLEDARHNNKK